MTLPDLSGAVDIAAARRIVARLLEAAGIESPALDARLLIQHALGVNHTKLASHPARHLNDAERETVRQMTARRLNGEPVARITGEKEFFGRPFRLSPATLVPRPETETVVEAAMHTIYDSPDAWHRPHRIADLGTGSGAILLALLCEIPTATGVGTDRSYDAVATARANAAALNLSNYASFVVMDFGAALHCEFDLVVSNPPYIASGDIESLAREVREYDPRRALDGGPDGLDAYRAIARHAPALLRDAGVLIVEIGIGQRTAVEAIMTAGGAFEIVLARSDLSGIPRALTFAKAPSGRLRMGCGTA